MILPPPSPAGGGWGEGKVTSIGWIQARLLLLARLDKPEKGVLERPHRRYQIHRQSAEQRDQRDADPKEVGEGVLIRVIENRVGRIVHGGRELRRGAERHSDDER